jgi:hypothetical protein
MTAPRRRPCTAQEAATRYRQAVAYLETATAVLSDGALPADYDYNHVACGVAVLAASAARDAICCRLLGERPRGQHHHEAVALLATVRFGDGTDGVRAKRARDLAAALTTVLDLKDASHYGTSLLGTAQVRKVVRAAEKLVRAAGEALDRR